MSEVKRYDCTDGGAAWCQGCYTMTENEGYGDWVKFDAYDALRAQLDEARAELAKALGELVEARALADCWKNIAAMDRCSVAQLMGDLTEARAELAKVRKVRDEWCAEYTKARDERDALRAAIEAHNASAKATGLVWADDWMIPLPHADRGEASADDHDKVAHDLRMYGRAFVKDGKHVPVEDVLIAPGMSDRGEASAEPSEAFAKPMSAYHEDYGPVLWWKFPIEEPPFCGWPDGSDWPGYHTHWTRLPKPPRLAEQQSLAQPEGGK
jgi:hypothetical protein